MSGLFAFVQEHSLLCSAVVAFAASRVEAIRRVVPLVCGWAMRRVCVTVTVEERDELHGWLRSWLVRSTPHCRDVTAYTGCSESDDDDAPPSATPIFFAPAKGSHLIWIDRRPVLLACEAGDDLRKRSGTITVTFFGASRHDVARWLSQVRDHTTPADGRITVRISDASYGGDWKQVDRVRPRPLDSVVLTENRHLEILQDIRRFQASAERYRERGIPYRRGYLLHGPPGNGKTSAVVAIAGALGMGVSILSLADHELNDRRLLELLIEVSRSSIVLIEDVDCAFEQREGAEARSLTFSGLLNALDGIASKEGRLLFLTTNHIDRLDPALIRPGRIDRTCYIGNAERDQVLALLRRFYPEADPALVVRAADLVPCGQISVAALQGALMQHETLEDALRDLRRLAESPEKAENPPLISR